MISASLDERANVIRLTLRDAEDSLPWQVDFAEAVEALELPHIVVDRASSFAVTTSCTFPYCDPPLRAGVRLNSSDSCSSGFLARSRSDNVLYVVTAGHCEYVVGLYYGVWGGNWTTRQPRNGATNHIVGPVHSWTYSASGDSGIIRVVNPTGWNARAWAYVHASTPQVQPPPPLLPIGGTTYQPEYPILADANAMQGQRVCRSGGSSLTECGYVSSTSSWHSDSALGVTVYGLLRVSGFCHMTGGDSGGPVYSSNTAWGIVMGRASGSGCPGWVEPIRRVESARNVDVAHHGG
jgi:hypothetical protein